MTIRHLHLSRRFRQKAWSHLRSGSLVPPRLCVGVPWCTEKKREAGDLGTHPGGSAFVSTPVSRFVCLPSDSSMCLQALGTCKFAVLAFFSPEQALILWFCVGPAWGDSGYIKLVRGLTSSPTGQCGIAMQASYPTKTTPNPPPTPPTPPEPPTPPPGPEPTQCDDATSCPNGRFPILVLRPNVWWHVILAVLNGNCRPGTVFRIRNQVADLDNMI